MRMQSRAGSSFRLHLRRDAADELRIWNLRQPKLYRDRYFVGMEKYFIFQNYIAVLLPVHVEL